MFGLASLEEFTNIEEFANFLLDNLKDRGRFGEIEYEYVGEGDSARVYKFRKLGESVYRYVIKVSVLDDYIGDFLRLDDVDVLLISNELGDHRIVRMYDYGDHYIVSDFVDGVDVYEAVNSELVDRIWVDRMVAGLTNLVLEYREYGVLLGDLSGDNVLVRDDLSWVIVDVGSSSPVSDDMIEFDEVYKDVDEHYID